jgi:hypothetical protein
MTAKIGTIDPTSCDTPRVPPIAFEGTVGELFVGHATHREPTSLSLAVTCTRAYAISSWVASPVRISNASPRLC